MPTGFGAQTYSTKVGFWDHEISHAFGPFKPPNDMKLILVDKFTLDWVCVGCESESEGYFFPDQMFF